MESLTDTYIGWLILSGELGKDHYLLTWNKENLNAYVQLTGPGALDLAIVTPTWQGWSLMASKRNSVGSRLVRYSTMGCSAKNPEGS